MVSGWTETGAGRRPKPGDATICLYCMAVNVYGPDLKPVLPTPEEAAAFAQDPKIQTIIRHLRARKLDEALKPPSQRGLMGRA
jgi:hypothetical protein